jgi:hypothetical protein
LLPFASIIQTMLSSLLDDRIVCVLGVLSSFNDK